MLLVNIKWKALNWQRRIEKEITLLKFRDIIYYISETSETYISFNVSKYSLSNVGTWNSTNTTQVCSSGHGIITTIPKLLRNCLSLLGLFREVFSLQEKCNPVAEIQQCQRSPRDNCRSCVLLTIVRIRQKVWIQMQIRSYRT